MKFLDNNNRPLTLTFREETDKGWFGKIKTTSFVKITIGNHWAEFKTEYFDWEELIEGKIIESDSCSDGAMFITNMRFAEPYTLFAEQTGGVPANSWVMFFTLLDENNVQAIFDDQDFRELVCSIRAYSFEE